LSLGEDPKSVTNYLNVTKGKDTNDGGDVVTPTVQIFLGKVIKEEEFSESEEVSISSTFYTRLFCAKVFFSDFL
jgi:hypothetical protein